VCSTGVTGARKKTGARCCSDRCEAELAAAGAAGVDLEQRKTCCGCTTAKPLSEFWDAARRPDGTSMSADGKQSRCKVCVRAGARHHSRRAGARRRVRKSAREIPFTAAQRTARWSLWVSRCWICGIAGATEEDHVKPLSKGGWHCLANLRPISKPCNVRKSNRWPLATEYTFHGYRHPHPRQGTDTHPLRAQHEVRCTHCSRPSTPEQGPDGLRARYRVSAHDCDPGAL
jgi:5-methylcytosine-specific restriction endonuclease McrA